VYNCIIYMFYYILAYKLRVFENWVLRKIFGFQTEVQQKCGRWRKEELYDLCFSPNIIPMVKSRIRWVGHVARMAKSSGLYRVLMGKPARKMLLGRPRCSCARILLKWIFKEKDGKWTGLLRLRIRTNGGVM